MERDSVFYQTLSRSKPLLSEHVYRFRLSNLKRSCSRIFFIHIFKEMEVWRPCLQRGPGAEPLAFLTAKLNVGWYKIGEQCLGRAGACAGYFRPSPQTPRHSYQTPTAALSK